jgi:DNA-binding winged helix-turn-helix (wHTH) protein
MEVHSEMLALIDEERTVSNHHRVVHLLPKEFELLKFMYEHPNRTFSRQQLLDVVWNLESPVDRTVDDHIYRLRKKLAIFSDDVKLDTIRGRGYRLTLISDPDNFTTPYPNPLLNNQEYRATMQGLFNFYVLHGTGQGIRTLMNSPEVFGLHKDPILSFRARYMEGDFRSIAKDTVTPIEERLYIMFMLYYYLQFDYKESLCFAEKIIEKYLLRTEHHLEMITFDLPLLYLLAGDRERADSTMADAAVACSVMPDYLDGYIPLVRIRDVMFSLFNRDLSVAQIKLQRAEKMILNLQLQRENGYLDIVHGMYAWAVENDAKRAGRCIDKGLRHLREIGFEHYYIARVHETVHFFSNLFPEPYLHAKYREFWKRLSDKHEFPRLIIALKKQLTHILT